MREPGHSLYPENGNFDWQWNSSSNRIKYNDLRIASVNWNKYANFAIAGLVVNRIISVIDVIYLNRTGKNSGFSSKLISNGHNNTHLEVKFSF